ncbi:MAG: ATP-binding cassette domain-containing protein, partial [Acholeplasmatales bacterium]|nr:ATP-binding cassette domain-containing protein [Acholeplasmatales bacterium]
RKKRADSISGGQMQRVSIARALVKTCKIIIADEPTGNLDSNNSIEIMNILKKISETALVILVTHDRNLANFYSDQIIELKDGKILDISTPKKLDSLKNIDDNKVYLKDLNLKEDGATIKSKVYSSIDIPNIELTLVEKNGTYYIDSNVKLKLLSDSNLLLLDEHYNDVTIEDVKESISFDNKWYNNDYKNSIFKSIFTNLKSSLKSYFKMSRKTKLFRLALLFIGMIIGISSVLLCQYSTLDKSTVIHDDDIYTIDGKQTYNNQREVLEALEDAYYEGILNNIDVLDKRWVYISRKHNSYEETNVEVYTARSSLSLVKDYELFLGEFPKDAGGCILGYDLAAKIKKDLKFKTFDKLIGLEVDNLKITGISTKKSNIYYSDSNDFHYNVFSINKVEEVSNIEFRYYDYEYYTPLFEDQFEDITESDENTLLINANRMLYDTPDITIDYAYNYYGIDPETKKIIINGKEYTVKGFVTTYTTECIYISSDLEDALLENVNMYAMPASASKGAVITEGRMATGANEITVSAYSAKEIGDKIEDFTIVGKYKLDFSNPEFNYFYSYEYQHEIAIMNDTQFKLETGQIYHISTVDNFILSPKTTEDFEGLKAFLSDYDIKLQSIYDFTYEKAINENNIGKQITGIIIVILLAISLIYIYFTMRSKMLQDIYEIGVLRSLGASRLSIVLKHIIDIFVVTSLTTAVGYIGVAVVFVYVFDKLNVLTGSSVMIVNNPIVYLCFIVLFVANIIIGIIPILTLLRKTPSEIISKYDI